MAVIYAGSLIIVEGMGVTLAGVPVHGVDAAGVEWVAEGVGGWWAAPESSGELSRRAYRDGAWAEPAFHVGKTLVVSGGLIAPDRVKARDAVENLMGAVPLDVPAALVVSEDGLDRHMMVRQEGQPIVEWLSDRVVRWNVQLQAPDPRRFSGDGVAPTYSAITYLPEQSGGLTAPFTAPFTVPGVVTSGSVTVTNKGTARTPVRATMYGPLDNPVLRSGTQSMTFNLSLDATEYLVVDLDARTAKLNGQASRRGTMTGHWITVAPGDSLSFDASTYSSAARMIVEWSDSWR